MSVLGIELRPQWWESNPGHPLTTVGMKTQVENFKKWKNSLVYFSIDYLV